MSSVKEKLRGMVVKLIEMSLDDHYSGGGHKERCKGVLAMDAFAYLRDHPQTDKISGFVADLMQGVASDAWQRNRVKVIHTIMQEVESLIEELLTDEEAADVLAFGSTPTGQKVFRNLDLLRNGILKGRNYMTAEIISAWSDPSVAQAINDYIEGLGDEPCQ